MTWAEVVYDISAMRSKSLNDRQIKAWVTRLERWQPEVIKREADKLFDTWELASDWPIGALIKRLGRPHDAEPEKPFAGFCWDSFTGSTRGDWAKFEALPADEREDVANHLEAFEGSTGIHAETVRRMRP